MTEYNATLEELRILKERFDLRAAEGDPILRVLQGRNLSLLDCALVWVDLSNRAEDFYQQALAQGVSISFADKILTQKKEELAALLEREIP